LSIIEEPEAPEPQEDVIVTGVPEEPPPEPPSGRRQPKEKTFTEADMEKARQQAAAQLEQNKALQAQLAEFQKTDEERRKAEEKAQRQAEAAAKKKEEEQMELRDLINKKDEEHQAAIAQERANRERIEAMLEQERAHAALQQYLNMRMLSEGDDIIDELRDLVGGNTPEEIDRSIEDMKARSQKIGDGFMSLGQAQRAGMRGATITSPPIGPREQSDTQKVWTADELRKLTPEEYAAVREDLHRAMAAQRR
jgi:hypothetical protein